MRYVLTFVAAGLLAFAGFAANPAASTYADVDTALYGTNDRLVITSLGINAPVNSRNVGADGIMHDPAGKDDVVVYSFPAFQGIGGYPGLGGTAVVAGHVDYRPAQQAVFWHLRSAVPGTQIDYYRYDGAVVTYVVDWVTRTSGEDDIVDYVISSNPETMVLISCEGTFNSATGNYDGRTIVHAVRTS